jgi:hypothetical protein
MKLNLKKLRREARGEGVHTRNWQRKPPVKQEWASCVSDGLNPAVQVAPIKDKYEVHWVGGHS